MFGKIFTSLYKGSMVGAGVVPFAVMPYVIANAVPDKEVGGYVELQPKLLSTIFGCSVKEVQDAIDFLCAPDDDTGTPGEEGRRLIKLGPYAYRVVNFEHYRRLRNEEMRREQNRVSQAKFRAKQASLDAMTPEQRKAYEKEYRKRRKHAAGCQGAQDALADGLSEAAQIQQQESQP